jgi:predicted AlkP superfamily pyrophosphatase or phosphodiesterase
MLLGQRRVIRMFLANGFRASVFRQYVSVLFGLLLTVSLGAFGQTKPQSKEAAGPQPRHDQHVVIVSIDGMLPDYFIEPARIGLHLPTLTSLRLGGSFAAGMNGVYPSGDYPSHATIATGVNPQFHGVTNDSGFDSSAAVRPAPEYSFTTALKSEPIWAAAKRGDLITAAVGWPTTAGAGIDYNLPEVWSPDQDQLTGTQAAPYATPGLLQKVLAAYPSAKGDELRSRIAEFIIKNYRPNLLLVRLTELDQTHHKFGPRTPTALQTMEREDGYVNQLIQSTRDAAIYDQTTFIVLSDHGSAAVTKRFEPNVTLVRAKLITLDAAGKPVEWKAAAWPSGGSCAIVLKDPKDKETADRVTALFEKIPLRSRSPLNRVVGRLELDRLEALPQAFLMLDAAPAVYIDGEFTGSEVREAEKDYRGANGYVPTRAEMWASLIIFGAGARVGAKIEIAQMIDIAVTAAAILGVNLPDAEGIPISELIKPEFIPPPDPAKLKRERDRKKAEQQKATDQQKTEPPSPQ